MIFEALKTMQFSLRCRDIRKAGYTEVYFHDNFGRCTPEFHKCDVHNPIGAGSIDWREIILAMLDINYSGIITFEQSDFKTNAFNWREFMKPIC